MSSLKHHSLKILSLYASCMQVEMSVDATDRSFVRCPLTLLHSTLTWPTMHSVLAKVRTRSTKYTFTEGLEALFDEIHEIADERVLGMQRWPPPRSQRQLFPLPTE